MKNLDKDLEVYKLRKQFYESISKFNDVENIRIENLKIIANIHNFEEANANKISKLSREMEKFVVHMEKIKADFVNS